MDPDPSLSRRTMLQRGFFMMLGALGVTSAQNVFPAAAAAETTKGPRTLQLTGVDFQYWAEGGVAVVAPAHGDRATLTGRLVSADGTQIGDFRGESVFVEGAFVGTSADTTLERHTFSLGDGSISGTGVRGTGESAFTVVGGTGRFASAAGTYAATLSLPEFGGDGSATFQFHFTSAQP